MQAEALIQYRFGLSRQELDALDDDEFTDLAARARFLDEHEAELLRVGFLRAVADLFGQSG
ncbi:MAG: hypothetical protein IMW99_03650 [Firmicutes bacterium]|nr:hypothetical protein [Bacillota bacterium]